MTQHEILMFLKNNESEWFSSKDISENIDNSSHNRTMIKLKKLRRSGMVKSKQTVSRRANIKIFLYKYKKDESAGSG
jgi:hypothetical protein